METRLISFTLYGSAPKYNLGAIENSIIAKSVYPDWITRFYCGDDVPGETKRELRKNNADVVGFRNDIPPMMQRYLVFDDPSVDRAIVRDCDSRLSVREKACVDRWIESDLIFLCLRDNPGQTPFPGGLFGIQVKRDNWHAPSFHESIKTFLAHNPHVDPAGYGTDQLWLEQAVWPWLRNSCLIFDSTGPREGALPFPTPRKDWPRFCGEVWEIGPDGEYPRDGDWQNTPKD